MPTVTAGEIVRRVKSLMADRSGTFILSTDIYDWIMDAQREISRIAECLQSNTTINSVALQEVYALNDAILKVQKVTYQGKKLQPTTFEWLEQIDPHRDSATTGGTPTHFYTDSPNVIGIWPKPSSAVVNGISVRAKIMATDTIDADTDVLSIPDYFRGEVIKFCMLKARERDEDAEMLALLMTDWKDKMAIGKSIANNMEHSYHSIMDSESALDYYPEWY